MIFSAALLLALASSDEAALQSALARAESAQPVHLPTVDNALLEYAHFLHAQGRYRQAEPLYMRSREIAVAVYGPESRATGLSLLRLSILYHNELRFGQCEVLARRAVDLLKTPESLESAYALATLATAIASQGDNARAEPVLRRAIYQIRKFQPADPKLTTLEVNLALIYLRQEELLKGQIILETLLEERAGDADILAALAELSIAQKRWPQARRFISDAYKQTPAGQPVQAGILHLKAAVETHDGDIRAAAGDLRQSLELTEALAGPDSPALRPLLHDYAVVLRRCHRNADAKAALRRARVLEAQP